MPKQDRIEEIQPDFKTFYSDVVPPKDNSSYIDKQTGQRKESEQSDRYKTFIKIFRSLLKEKLQKNVKFPTKNQVFVFLVQFFHTQKSYYSYDLDNMAKTVLDVLKIHCYKDDGQVKLLLVYKKQCDERVKENHAYISIKILNDDRDLKIVKEAGLEKAVTSYQDKISSLQKTFRTI